MYAAFGELCTRRRIGYIDSPLEVNLMTKRKTMLDKKQNRLLCPLCRTTVDHALTVQSTGRRGEFLPEPEPGNITQCHHCMALLEYGGSPSSLTLQIAPRGRVKEFHKLTQEGFPEPSLPELLAYIKKFRSMPERSSTACKFRPT